MGGMFSRLSFNQKLVLLNVVGTVFSCVAIVVSALYFVSSEMKGAEIEQQARNLRVAVEIVNPKREPYRIVDGKLMVGDRPLEGSSEYADRIKNALGITASIFRDDTRVQTTIVNPDGSRPLGTKMPADIHQRVVQRGEGFLGEYPVLGVPYLVTYEPLKDASGKAVGAIAVGMPSGEFYAIVGQLGWRIGAVSLAVGVVIVFVAYQFVRGQMRSLHRLVEVMGGLRNKNYSVIIASDDTDRTDEIGDIARAVASFKDSLVQAEEADRRQREVEAEQSRRRAEMDRATQSFAANIDVVVRAVSDSATRMRGNAERLSRNAEETQAAVSSVSAASHQASTNVETVAAAAEELTASIGEISRHVGEAS